MTEYVLREFVCCECGHTVVVHPDLPLDYMPTVCTPCYERIDVPKQWRAHVELGQALQEFLAMLTEGAEPGPNFKRMKRRSELPITKDEISG